MRSTQRKHLKIISGSIHPDLAAAIANRIRVPLAKIKLDHFANGEIKCEIMESVRGADVFIIQTHSMPVNDAIIEQAILIDAAKRASARRIVAVCPFFGYSRQGRKASGREPITARLITDILKMAGADSIVGVDLHSGQTQGFFDGPFDHLIALPVLADHIQKSFGPNCVIVSPDAGRVKLAERYTRLLGNDLAIFHKRRLGGSKAEVLHLVGDVKNRRCVIIDDMIDSAGTICAAAGQLQKLGASSITVIATHGIFSGPAVQRLETSPIDTIVVTDTLPLSVALKKPKIETVSIVPLIADAIVAMYDERSVSELFGGENQI